MKYLGLVLAAGVGVKNWGQELLAILGMCRIASLPKLRDKNKVKECHLLLELEGAEKCSVDKLNQEVGYLAVLLELEGSEKCSLLC